MSGKRQPLAVLEAKGKKHLTKAEIEKRRSSEVKSPECKRVRWPDFLPEDLRKEFNEISAQLIDLGIFCKLDRDALAMYLISREGWIAAQERLSSAVSLGGKTEAQTWSSVASGYFKQCRQCANELGLNITARCRLVIPNTEDESEDDELMKLLRDMA